MPILASYQLMTYQDAMDGDDRQPDPFLRQQHLQLARSPVRPLLPQPHHSLLDPGLGLLRAALRPPALLHHSLVASSLAPASPFISGRSRDIELLAQLLQGLFLATGCNHKPHPLFFHVHFPPRHPCPLSKGSFHLSALASLGR